MLTKTKTETIQNPNLSASQCFNIPKIIQKDINEKWFHLYNWIWEDDVKLSIERDFLKYISKYWTAISISLILPALILWYISETLFYIYFFWFLWIINIVLLLFLTLISIKRSSILRKNAQVLITDSSISINWKIRKLQNNKIVSNENLDWIWKLFEEKIFQESNIGKTKKWFFTQVVDQITEWFAFIFKSWKWSSRDSQKGMLVLLVLYLIYTISISIIYFFWILFIWIFWIFLSFINKKILLISGHKITSINNGFENIDSYSKELIKEKNNLSNLLDNAMNNDWKDSLLTKINDWIENINLYASRSVDRSLELKKEIKTSKYKEMFNFSIYNSWIKKQIYIPLEQIVKLLEKNLGILKTKKESIKKQILQTKDPSLQCPLIANKKRIEMRIVEIEKHIKKINIYMNKLK